MTGIKRFNIRIYGILINDRQQLLVADEIYSGMKCTKFPGGGLEFGEGPVDCIKREWVEETGTALSHVEHLYTTEYFQRSAFVESDQILSIYYRVKSAQWTDIPVQQERFNFGTDSLEEDIEVFRWIPMNELTADEFQLPIDKKVAAMILSGWATRS